MIRRIRSNRRTGFSLVELLAVIGIIALLIGILVPSISVARTRAKSASCQNTIRVLETALETFKADMVVGGAYPESAALVKIPPATLISLVPSPHSNNQVPVCGASFLVWALAGADLLGTPGFKDLDANGTWRNDTGKMVGGLYELAGDQPVQPRYGPFVSMEKMRVPKQTPTGFIIEKYNAGPLTSTCFLDAFEQPILYYRANAAGRIIAGVQTALGTATAGLGIYDLHDNYLFTGVRNDNNAFGGRLTMDIGLDLGAGRLHPLRFLGDPTAPLASPKGSFSNVLWDRNITAAARPQRADSFILLSAGPDHKYGTPDDIGNFNIPK